MAAAVTQRSLGRGARERIVTAARDLFAQRGIGATTMDDVHRTARVSKRTLYQHFASRDKLVLACLLAAGSDRHSGAEAVLARGELAPRALLLELFTELSDRPRPLRGDLFVNAAIEFPDPSHPVHRAVAEHARRFEQRLGDLARAAGARDPERVGRRLGLLYAGAATRSLVGDDPGPASDGYALAAALLRDAID